jgi:hypothetical protein
VKDTRGRAPNGAQGFFHENTSSVQLWFLPYLRMSARPNLNGPKTSHSVTATSRELKDISKLFPTKTVQGIEALEPRVFRSNLETASLIEFFHPNISDGNLARRTLNLEANKPRLIIHVVRVVVDEYGH